MINYIRYVYEGLNILPAYAKISVNICLMSSHIVESNIDGSILSRQEKESLSLSKRYRSRYKEEYSRRVLVKEDAYLHICYQQW